MSISVVLAWIFILILILMGTVTVFAFSLIVVSVNYWSDLDEFHDSLSIGDKFVGHLDGVSIFLQDGVTYTSTITDIENGWYTFKTVYDDDPENFYEDKLMIESLYEKFSGLTKLD